MTPDRIAVCQHPHGDGLYVPARDIRGGRCFEPGCDCTPRIYVAVDARPANKVAVALAVRSAVRNHDQESGA